VERELFSRPFEGKEDVQSALKFAHFLPLMQDIITVVDGRVLHSFTSQLNLNTLCRTQTSTFRFDVSTCCGLCSVRGRIGKNVSG
jgi:hypothetical protein